MRLTLAERHGRVHESIMRESKAALGRTQAVLAAAQTGVKKTPTEGRRGRTKTKLPPPRS
jgi:hypothetical protein